MLSRLATVFRYSGTILTAGAIVLLGLIFVGQSASDMTLGVKIWLLIFSFVPIVAGFTIAFVIDDPR